MKFKFIIITIMTLIFGFVSPVHATSSIPTPTLKFYLVNEHRIQIIVDNGQYQYNYHICPSSLNKPTGNKLSDGQNEYKCDSIKLSYGSFSTYYELPSNSSESFTTIAEERSTGNWSLWSNWQHVTNTYKPYVYNTSTTNSIPLSWKEAGCDNLWGLNQEALEWDFNAAWQANFKVQLQRDYPTVSDYGCPNKLAWKWKTVKVKQFVWQYTLCNDGWKSSSTGRGTCSWHGGINSYRGYYKTVNAKRPQFYWVY